MKELFDLLIHFKLKKLFFEPTKNGMIQFFRYAFVGGIATVVDWAVQYSLTVLWVHYLIAAIFAFLSGLVVNYFLSKIFVFKAQEAKVNAALEFVIYALIGAIGLGITVGLMFLLTDIAGLYFMLSKVITTVIVLFWNYFARKLIIYKK